MIVVSVHKALKTLSRILAWETERLYRKTCRLQEKQKQVATALVAKQEYWKQLAVLSAQIADEEVQRLANLERTAYQTANKAYDHILILNRITEGTK